MRTATIYNFLIEANIMAGLAILLMIPVRKFFRKTLGNRAICFAWLLVAIRLLCPLALPNPLMNEIVTPYNDQQSAVRPMAGQIRVRLRDALEDASWESVDAIMEREGLSYKDAIRQPAYQALSRMRSGMLNGRLPRAVMAAYACGLAGIAGWFALANVKFRGRLKKNRVEPIGGEIREYYERQCEKLGVKPLPAYYVDPLASACLVGALRPFIALPLAATESQAKQMLCHELCHYKARDHVWALVTLLCCALHWFNPLVWAAAAMSRLDRELKCDDSVIRDMDEDARRLYAGALLQSVARRAMPGMPMLATGMSMTGRKMKTRIGGILWGGKRVKALARSFALGASVLLVLAFGTAAAPWARSEEPWDNDVNAAERSYLWSEENGQRLEDALASENAIPTKEAAIQKAKELLSSEYWKIDVEDEAWAWTVDDTQYGVMNRRNYQVTAADKQGRGVTVCMAVDGSGAWMIVNTGDPYFMEDYASKYEYTQSIGLPEEEIERIKQFCREFTEMAEPGETAYFQVVQVNCYMTVDDTVYAQVEAAYNQDSSKGFTLEVKPELRLIDYFTGNG